MEKRFLLAAALSLGVLLALGVARPQAAASPPPPPAARRAGRCTRGRRRPRRRRGSIAAPALPPRAGRRCRPPASAAAETTDDHSRTTSSRRRSPTGAPSSSSFVLTRHTDEQKQPLELVAQLRRGCRDRSRLDFARTPPTTEAGRRARSSPSSASRTAVRALPLRRRDDRRHQGDSLRRGIPLRRQGHGRRAALQRARRPGPSQSASAERGFALRHAGAAHRRRPPTGSKRVAAEKAQAEERLADCRGDSPASKTTTSSRSSCPQRAERRRALIAFSVPRPDGQALRRVAAGDRGQGRFGASAYFGPKDVEVLESYGLGLRADGGLRLVRDPRAAAPVAAEEYLRLGRQLGRRDPARDVLDPHPALPADGQELRVDEEDAEARAEDERDPGQVQEGQDRRGAAPEDERGADEALPGGGLQPDERVLPDPAAAADPRRLLQRAVAHDRAAPRAVRLLDQGSLGDGPAPTSCSS